MRRWSSLPPVLCLAAAVGCSSTATNTGTGGSAGGGTGGSAGGGVSKRLFVTSTTLYLDALGGGLSGADQTCTEAAAGGSLPGIWMAVLSDAKVSAKDRLTIDMPVVNTKGELLAAGADELWDGNLATAVRYDERGDFVGGAAVWSATNPNGSAAVGDACGSWTNQNNSQVMLGSASASDAKWIAANQGYCSEKAALYCLEQ